MLRLWIAEKRKSVTVVIDPDLLPLGEDWSLADLLDCNAARLDVVSNGDGVLDALVGPI